MRRQHTEIYVLAALVISVAGPVLADAGWSVSLNPYHGALSAVGVHSAATDGWDGAAFPGHESPLPWSTLQTYQGVLLLFYHESGHNWNGPTGFYGEDLRSPIPPGGSKTWSDLYLWAQNYTSDPPSRVDVLFQSVPGTTVGYNFRLVLDYVPDSANWTGLRQFDIAGSDIGYYGPWITLPVVEVTDPFQGVKMHLTVYNGPIPEPSSLAALGLALTAMLSLSKHGAFVRRRRR